MMDRRLIEEADNARQLREAFLRERDSARTGNGGKGSHAGSRSSNGGQVKSSAIGVTRDKVSRGETRQSFSLSESSNQAAVSSGTGNASVPGGSLVGASTDEVLPGQNVAGQGTICGNAEPTASGETEQLEGGGGSNVLRDDSWKLYASEKARWCPKVNISRGLCARMYWKISQGRVPTQRNLPRRGLNKMDRNMVISASSDGSGEGELSLSVAETLVS